MYVCLSNFRTFVNFSIRTRALFGKTGGTRIHEARPDTLVQVSARSVHSGARDGHSEFFFSIGSGSDDFPVFSTRRLILYACVLVNNDICFLTYCGSTDCTFVRVGARSTDHLPDNNRSAHSVLTSSFLTPQLCCPAACGRQGTSGGHLRVPCRDRVIEV